VHPTQLRHAYDAMLAVVSDEYVPHVMTVNLVHGVKKTDFPRHSLLVLVHFWGDLAASTSGAFDGSSTVSGAAIGSLPNDLTLDTSFLKHGLTDVIHLPRVNVWRQRPVQTSGVPFASSSTPAMPPPVDDMQRPLELYLYFLVGFKFPSCINPGHCYVFDLCCGSGTASLAASMCSHHSIGIDTDADKIAQCKIRLREDAGHWQNAVKGFQRAPDFFMARTSKMSATNLPDDNSLKKQPWMPVETMHHRLLQSINGDVRDEEGGDEDDDAEMPDALGGLDSQDPD
jgi:hypothetical protein